jgi:hypothetical protein
MKFHSFALYTLMGCMGTGSLAFAQSDMTGAKPQTEETANMAAKQHTAGVPQGLLPDSGTAMKQHTAGVPLSMTRDPGTAYNPPKNQ